MVVDIRPPFFRDRPTYEHILANARVAKLTCFGILYIRRYLFWVAGLGRHRLSNLTHHGSRFRFIGNGTRSIRFESPSANGLRGCLATPQVKGSIGGGRFCGAVAA